MPPAFDLRERFGRAVRASRTRLGLSQEALAEKAGLDRTYVSDVERGVRNIGLENVQKLAVALDTEAATLLGPAGTTAPRYRVRHEFRHDCGFIIAATSVEKAAVRTAAELRSLPFSLFRSVDLKTLSGITGALFADAIAAETGGLVNPIEKGHPDVVPKLASTASEAALRNYPMGLEIKCTVGSVAKGSALKPGEPRVGALRGLTWQAHHREVRSLLGLVVDFAGDTASTARFPIITAAFFSDRLDEHDWGEISGTTGRNTKVTGMTQAGRRKLAAGWVAVLDQSPYPEAYGKILAASFAQD